jgi:hypothetical protein
MDSVEFESELQREGFTVIKGEFRSDPHPQAHDHAYDVRFLVLDGTITIVTDTNLLCSGWDTSSRICGSGGDEIHSGHAAARRTAASLSRCLAEQRPRMCRGHMKLMERVVFARPV